MIKSILVAFITVVGLPAYALCVAFLLMLRPIFGWSYVDASVYVCKYFQPVFTAAVALVFMIFAIRKIVKAFRHRTKVRGIVLSAISAGYLTIAVGCICELFVRLHTYGGMTNHQIFDFVVHKLSVIGSVYPAGRFRIFTGESISYGYIMANMEVYLLPISIVLLPGIIQWRLTRKISKP